MMTEFSFLGELSLVVLELRFRNSQQADRIMG